MRIANSFRIKVSDLVAKYVATWSFVFGYTGLMLGWILLHKTGVLRIDSPDFIKWNLFLSWFAGTQASVIMISSNRRAERDSKNISKGLEIDEHSVKVLKEILTEMSELDEVSERLGRIEGVISLIEEEERKKHELSEKGD
jgi:uncharacterized membrane protein